MTVSELKALLDAHPGDAEVWIEGYDGGAVAVYLPVGPVKAEGHRVLIEGRRP